MRKKKTKETDQYHVILLEALIPTEFMGRYWVHGDGKEQPEGSHWYVLGSQQMQLPVEFNQASTQASAM